MSDGELVVTQKATFSIRRQGRRKIETEPQPVAPPTNEGTIPRISRLMALAIHFDQLIGSGAIFDQAELGRLSHVTRARVTQIMNLLHLAPDIQESILTLPPTTQGRDPIRERHIRPICAAIMWSAQRTRWARLMAAGPMFPTPA